MFSFVVMWMLIKAPWSISRPIIRRGTYFSGVTVGRELLASFIILGSGVDAAGVLGTDMSSERRALPPKASRSSACFVLLLPSFIPEPLNAGARNDDGTGDAVRPGEEGTSNRCGTGE